MASRRIEPEMIVAIAAVVVGVCALAVSLFQASIMREQQAEMRVQRLAEVWPHIEFGTSYNGESFRLLALNTGIGPARVESVRLLIDDVPVPNWTTFLETVSGREAFNYQQSQIGSRVIPAGETLEVLVISDEVLSDSLRAYANRVTAEICYCSVYDECWDYTHAFARGPEREPIAACQTPEGAFEQ